MHDAHAQFRVSLLTAFHSDGNFDLVPRFEEFSRGTRLGLEVVSIDRHGKPNFLDLVLSLILFRLFVLLGLFKLIFAVVHKFAYGRSSLRADLDEVEIFFVRDTICGVRAHYPELFAVLADKTYLTIADLVIDFDFRLFNDNRVLRKK